jgi:hypothetical protein
MDLIDIGQVIISMAFVSLNTHNLWIITFFVKKKEEKK